MANFFDLSGEKQFNQIIGADKISSNERERKNNMERDDKKYALGISTINEKWQELFASAIAPHNPDDDKKPPRNSVHTLKNRWLAGKGLKKLEAAPFTFVWCVTFDLNNRSEGVGKDDPNGPRRFIVVLKNGYGEMDKQGTRWHSASGGTFLHLLYTNNHYKTFEYVHNWPLLGKAGGKLE